MGQKINPIGLRLGINRTWDSRWFADGPEYGKLLHEDIKLRRALKKRLYQAGVSRIVIERPHRKCRITIYAARPGVIIGKKGADIDKLRKDIASMTDGEVHLNIVEIRKPETDAQLVAENIAQQLERRVAFRRAMKRSMQSAMRLGAKGMRINVSGRLGGAEIARMEWYREGRVPLHTLRADIDYGFSEARTTYGIIGVKVWVFKGEVLDHDPMALDKRLASESGPPGEGGRDRADRGPRRDRREPRPAEGQVFAPQRQPQVQVLDRPPAAPDWAAGAEAAIMKALEILDRGQEGKAAAIAILLRQGQRALSEREIPQTLAQALAAIMPALLHELFDSSSQVRWGAAYGIAALHAPERFPPGDGIPRPETGLEARVRDTLEDHLRNSGEELISHVSMTVRRENGAYDVSGRVDILPELPLVLDGSRPRLDRPEWLGAAPVLDIAVSDARGRFSGRFTGGPGAADPARSPVAGTDFHFTAPAEPPTVVTLKLLLDGHRLEAHQLTTADFERLAAGGRG